MKSFKDKTNEEVWEDILYVDPQERESARKSRWIAGLGALAASVAAAAIASWVEFQGGWGILMAVGLAAAVLTAWMVYAAIESDYMKFNPAKDRFEEIQDQVEESIFEIARTYETRGDDHDLEIRHFSFRVSPPDDPESNGVITTEACIRTSSDQDRYIRFEAELMAPERGEEAGSTRYRLINRRRMDEEYEPVTDLTLEG
ncbi:hypothetical protein [Thioalkalivibrio sp. ALE23]|uniref:hypothetical protein n=1 Tax=Thioalkalivibrio sp. ALE23 TaxID=1265495 RepID=UPI000365830F|nr:hypothetical protein [Thioalkalivibrio sp. ALE23]